MLWIIATGVVVSLVLAARYGVSYEVSVMRDEYEKQKEDQ